MKNFLTRFFCSSVRQRLPQTDAVILESGAVCKTPARADIAKLSFGPPIKEDLNSGAVSANIHKHWSNVPLQTRELFESSRSSSSFFGAANSENAGSLVASARKFLSLIGKGPVDLASQRDKYCSEYQLQPYKTGMKAAYHWSQTLVPRAVAARCPGDLRVDPVDSDQSILLLDTLMDHTTVLFGFSGYDLSGLNTGVKAWKQALKEALNNCGTQVLNVHFSEGWLSRRTHPLTRQILRTFASHEPSDNDQSSVDKLLIYRGKWNRDLVLDFHLYNKSLPCVLLIDKRGYIRWHAVGLPTEETVDIIRRLLPRLRNEKI